MNLSFLFSHKWANISVVYFVFLVLWWFKIFFFGEIEGTENYFFDLSYFFFNAVGGIGGLIVARKWGGFRSAVGRGLSFLGLGLLSQGFGLLIWTYYNLVLQVEVPYPSLADLGYFSLIPFYSLAMFNFAKASGASLALKNIKGWIQVALLPFAVLMISYGLFIRDVGFDTPFLETFLNIAYPAGEAISVSLGLLTYSLSRGFLGGTMKKYVVYLIVALAFQYLTEFIFLYTSGLGTYYNASYVDLMYATAYFLMTLGLLSFKNIGN